MIFCILGRLGRGKIKHLGDDLQGKVKEGGMLLLHSVLIVHPYALEVLCLKVRTSLQVLGFTCTIYYPSFKSKIQSLDPLGSKSRKTRGVVVSLQRFEHCDLFFVKARKIVAYLFLKITLNVLHNLFQPSFLKGHKQETSPYILSILSSSILTNERIRNC